LISDPNDFEPIPPIGKAVKIKKNPCNHPEESPSAAGRSVIRRAKRSFLKLSKRFLS
jgi:hypothetical protein